MRQPTLFDAARTTLDQALAETAESLREHAARHHAWAVCWSGGKDSTATLTVVLYLIDSGAVPRPGRLVVLYADTRLELPPLHEAAMLMGAELRRRGVEVEIVQPPLERRFLSYVLGRGVPPPNNSTLRWCTRQIKLDPMRDRIRALLDEHDVLCITGVRIGESAARDARIAVSCGVNGAECGQGWYQRDLPGETADGAVAATLSPILHWRVCHVWEWLRFYAPHSDFGGIDTRLLAHVYGGDEAEEINARTGCAGCPLASRDTALESLIERGDTHLAPLMELRPLWRWCREPAQRLRKPTADRLRDGSIAANPQRMGPLTLAARSEALRRVLDIQRRAGVSLIDPAEERYIRGCIDGGVWPRGWVGDEPVADRPLAQIEYADGSVQPWMDMWEPPEPPEPSDESDGA